MRSRLIVFGFCASFGPLSTHLIVPVLADIADAFDVGLASVQFALSTYLVGLAVGQFVVGALADRFGLGRVLIGGLSIHFLACLVLAIAPSFDVFLAARAVHGLSGSAGMVIALAAIGRSRSPRMAVYGGYLMAWLSLMTMVAPVIGAFLAERFGWRGIFDATAVLVLAALVLALWQIWRDRSRQPEPLSHGTPSLIADARVLARNRTLIVHACEIAMTIGAFYFFIGVLPYATRDVFDLDVRGVGAWLFVVSTGLAVGVLGAGFIKPLAVPRIGILVGALVMAFATAVPMVLFAARGSIAAPALFIPIAVMAVGQTVVLSRAQIGAIESAPDRPGTAAGICGALQFAAGAVFAYLGGALVETVQGFLPALVGLFLMCSAIAGIAAMHLRSQTLST